MKVVVSQNGGTVKVIQTGGLGMSAVPGRTLYVAQSWPAGVDPTKCFTDVPSAMAAAAALTPPPDVSNPALIIFYPGLYSQPVTLLSNVHLCGHNARGCTITGAVTYTPGAGVNASQAGLYERVYISDMGISGAFSIDCTGKPIGQGTNVDCRAADISGNVTHKGRALTGGQDIFETWDGAHGGTWSFDGSTPFFRSGAELTGSSLNLSNCTIGSVFAGCRIFSTLNLVNSIAEGSGSKFSNVNVDGTSVFGPIPGGKSGIVTVASGGRADIRHAEYFGNANLAGAGAIDRTIWRTPVGPTSAGDNTVSLAPAYIDANYNVLLTQTAGTAASVFVSGKQAGQFTLTDAVGGNTFDVTIIKE